MNVHKNARLTPMGRELLAQRIESGWTVLSAATTAGVSTRTASKLVGTASSWRRAEASRPQLGAKTMPTRNRA